MMCFRKGNQYFAAQMVAEKMVRIDRAEEISQGMMNK
jgi:hypothetical protein